MVYSFWVIQDGQQPPVHMAPVHCWWHCKPSWNLRLPNCTYFTSSLSSEASVLCSHLYWVYHEGSCWRYWDMIFRGLTVISEKNATEGVTVAAGTPPVLQGCGPFPQILPYHTQVANDLYLTISNHLSLVSQTVAYMSSDAIFTFLFLVHFNPTSPLSLLLLISS